MSSSFKISLAFSTNFAPCFINLLHPFELEEYIGPGIAKTFLPCFLAYSAVIKAPDFSLASTTKTPKLNAEIILFLWGKVNFVPAVPGGYSDSKQPPSATIFLDKL